ncbi:MAG: HDOD domain-containing protein [Caldimonas sp.]
MANLAAWTSHFRRAQIPVLRETVEALDALRANEECTDANSIGEMIGGDPLMTLKVLAYVSDHRGRSVVTAPETVISALVMMGIPPFFRAFAAPVAVEDELAHAPDALAGLQRVLRRAHRGARFALAFAVHRTDPHAATVHAAALLHEFAELLLWSHAPSLALRIRALQDADPTLRSSAAQLSVLHIELDELQQALVAAWRLPSLLAETSQEPQAGQIGARAVALGCRLARHTAGGWENAALPDDIAEIAAFLNLSPAAVLKLVTEIDAE